MYKFLLRFCTLGCIYYLISLQSSSKTSYYYQNDAEEIQVKISLIIVVITLVVFDLFCCIRTERITPRRPAYRLPFSTPERRNELRISRTEPAARFERLTESSEITPTGLTEEQKGSTEK